MTNTLVAVDHESSYANFNDKVDHQLPTAEKVEDKLTSEIQIVTLLKQHCGLGVEFIWEILTFIGTYVVLNNVNRILDTLCYWYIAQIHLAGRWPHWAGDWSTDDVTPPGKDIDISLDEHKYGPHRLENIDVMRPTSGEAGTKKLVYCHGGGWVAANSTILLHSVTPFVRNGYTVYSANYPLAPETRFPGPVVSLMRMLRYMKDEVGVDEVYVLGDSAGANVATMAIVLVADHDLYHEFADAVLKESGEDISNWKLPKIKGIIAAYGIHCQGMGWGKRLESVNWLENTLWHFGLSYIQRVYKSKTNCFGNRFTLMDIADDIDTLPPMFLFCGDQDKLSMSSQYAFEKLGDLGYDVTYSVYPGRHAFFGFPPAWLGRDRASVSSMKAVRDCLEFFRRCDTEKAKVK